MTTAKDLVVELQLAQHPLHLLLAESGVLAELEPFLGADVEPARARPDGEGHGNDLGTVGQPSGRQELEGDAH